MSKLNKNRLFLPLFSVAGVIILSKLMGFVKQIVTASAYGATIETDIINLAEGFIGNIHYVLVQVLLTAFTATYIHCREQEEASAKRFAMESAKTFSMIASAIALLVMVGAPVIAKVIAPSYTAEQTKELANYLRLFAPALICFVWIAISHALLNAHQRFIPGELVGLNQSVILILLVTFFRPLWGVQVLAVAFCAYTVWNTLYLVTLSRRYWGRSAGNPFSSPAVRKLLKMSGPLLLGYSMVYINQQVDKILSSGLETGTVTAMGYAAVLSNLVGTFIVSFCSILFTYITKRISQEEHQGAAELTVRSAELLVLVFLPISILTILCAEDIVSIVYGRGAFQPESVWVASMALVGYGAAFVPLVLCELFSRFQYGYQETKRPMINSTIGVCLNIMLSIVLCRKWGVLGITVASSVSQMICGILNMLTAKKYNDKLRFGPLLRQMPIMILGSIVCWLAAAWVRSMLIHHNVLIRFAVAALVGGLGYLAIVWPILLKIWREKDKLSL